MITSAHFRFTLRRRAATLLAVALGAQAGTACAADTAGDLTTLPLEQLLAMEVYSASKFKQDARDAPALVTVISAADIRRHGWRTLGDVARSVRGLYVSYDRNYSYLGARGFLRPGDYNTRFLLLVDGNRVNDAVYDQAPLGGEFPLDLALIERIEFVPGPGSSIYGSNAFFGVINVVTRTATDLPGVRAALEAGSAGARKAAVSGAWRGKDGRELLVAASSHRSAGRDLYYPQFDTPDQNHGVAAGLDYERGERLLVSAAGASVGLTLMHARRIKGVPTASFYQPFNDPRSRTTDRQTYVNLHYRSSVKGPEQASARLFWGRYDSFGDYVIDDAERGINHDGSQANWWGAELSLVSTRFAGHRLLAGLDHQRDYRLHQYNYDQAPFYSYLDQHHQGRRTGIYLQDEIELSPAVLVNLGLRYDRSDGARGVFSPRAALIWKLSEATTFKAIYGAAFRSPNAYERFYAYPGAGGQLPNPGLGRETIRSSELGLVHQLDDRARLTATVFSNQVGQLITLGTPPGGPETRFDNGMRVRARGAELEYERRALSGAALRASYSYARAGAAQASADGGQFNAPAALAKVNASLPLARSGWHGALEAQYVGARQGLNAAVPGFWLANLNFTTTRLWRGAEASIGVYNLFDRRYADPGSTEHRQQAIEQDGRSLRARIGYAF